MWFLFTLFVFWTAGISFSWLAWKAERFEEDPLFLLAGVVIGIPSGLAAIHAAVMSGSAVLFFAWPVALGGLFFAPFVVKLGYYLLEVARLGFMGEGSMTVEKTYDQAVAAERRRQWDRAISLYRKELAADPGDYRALLRIADIEEKRERPEECLGYCREALAHVDNARERAAIVFRIADLERQQGRVEAARRILVEFLDTSPEGRLERYAHARLEALAGG